MEFAEKMYLVPQHQLDKLKTESPRESIQQNVESDMDESIRNILHRNDLDVYEKAKLYSNALQRFLTIAKHRDLEVNTLTLSLPPSDHTDKEQTTLADKDDAPEDVVNDVLNNAPQKSLKNIRYILDKMSKAKDVSSWTGSGEFVFRGRPIHGSHLFDLVKSVTASHKIKDEHRPVGWSEFLEAISLLNLPYSILPNHAVRQAVQSFKSPATSSGVPAPYGKSKKRRSRARASVALSDEPLFKSPNLDYNKWLRF